VTSHSWLWSLQRHFSGNQVENPPASSSDFFIHGVLTGWQFTLELALKAVGLWMNFSSKMLQPHPFATAANWITEAV